MTMLAIGFPSAGVNAATNRIIDGNVTGKAKYHIGNSTAPSLMVAIALSRFGVPVAAALAAVRWSQ